MIQNQFGNSRREQQSIQHSIRVNSTFVQGQYWVDRLAQVMNKRQELESLSRVAFLVLERRHGCLYMRFPRELIPITQKERFSQKQNRTGFPNDKCG
jgi:hypothetical protein